MVCRKTETATGFDPVAVSVSLAWFVESGQLPLWIDFQIRRHSPPVRIHREDSRYHRDARILRRDRELLARRANRELDLGLARCRRSPA